MSLKDKQNWVKFEEETAPYAKTLNEKGMSVAFDAKKDTFNGEEEIKNAKLFAWSIYEAFDGILHNAGQDERDACAPITKIVMIKGAKNNLEISGSTLNVTTDLGESDNAATVRDNAKEWLLSNLG